MSDKIEQLKLDLADLQGLEKEATRPKIKDFLSLEARKISTEIIRLQEELVAQEAQPPSTSAPPPTTTSRRYEIKLNTYAWDQTPKFVKFYVTLPKVETLSEENVHCEFKTNSLTLTVKDLENKDYIFTINNLLHKVHPGKSTWKVKNDMVIINAYKQYMTSWTHVTELEKKASGGQTDKFKPGDASGDPNDTLMSLMKDMYNKGDDEMKRTIAKAWTESQNKSGALPL